MRFVWRYLTKPEGVTAAEIAKSTGKTNAEVLAELRGLEKAGRTKRKQGKVGKPHLWWKTERYPLCPLTTVLVLALAAAIHPSKSAVRSVIQRVSTRTVSKALNSVLALAATASDPHAVVAATLETDEVLHMLSMKYKD